MSVRGMGPAAGASPPPQHQSVTRGTELRLDLLDGFRLENGGGVLPLTLVEQRLLAFLAVHNRPLRRVFVAGNLWIDSDEAHASGNLRTTLWRVRQLDPRLIDSSRSHLTLAPGVIVDLHESTAYAHRVLRNEATGDPAGDPQRFAGDLLPDWYDDWVLIERERFRQLRLHALEALCEALGAAGAYGMAIEAGLACIAAEPLRESAHRALIKVHLAEGNPAEAVRHYRLYCKIVLDELGLPASGQMQRMIESLPIDDAAVTHALLDGNRAPHRRVGAGRRHRRASAGAGGRTG
jgi:DNA-binding SARP family transcriptional activator